MELIHSDVTGEVIAAAIEVHRHLGPGLLEVPYRLCLMHELGLRGFHVRSEVPVPLTYKGVQLEAGYRLDIVVEDKVIVELKAVKALEPIHDAQLLSYLRLTGLNVGLLIISMSPCFVMASAGSSSNLCELRVSVVF